MGRWKEWRWQIVGVRILEVSEIERQEVGVREGNMGNIGIVEGLQLLVITRSKAMTMA